MHPKHVVYLFTVSKENLGSQFVTAILAKLSMFVMTLSTTISTHTRADGLFSNTVHLDGYESGWYSYYAEAHKHYYRGNHLTKRSQR